MSPRPSDAGGPADPPTLSTASTERWQRSARPSHDSVRASRVPRRPISRRDAASCRALRSPLFWLHGASAGEMAAAVNLVALLRGAGFSFTAGFTTTNGAGATGCEGVRPADAVVSLAPWDAPRRRRAGLRLLVAERGVSRRDRDLAFVRLSPRCAAACRFSPSARASIRATWFAIGWRARSWRPRSRGSRQCWRRARSSGNASSISARSRSDASSPAI